MSVIWQPGMRCVCIEAGEPNACQGLHPLTKGRVYTVRDVFVSVLDGECGLRLTEIDNSHLIGVEFWHDDDLLWWTVEPGYLAELFRPLSERRLDQFRALLAPQPRETVPA